MILLNNCRQFYCHFRCRAITRREARLRGLKVDSLRCNLTFPPLPSAFGCKNKGLWYLALSDRCYCSFSFENMKPRALVTLRKYRRFFLRERAMGDRINNERNYSVRPLPFHHINFVQPRNMAHERTQPWPRQICEKFETVRKIKSNSLGPVDAVASTTEGMSMKANGFNVMDAGCLA